MLSKQPGDEVKRKHHYLQSISRNPITASVVSLIVVIIVMTVLAGSVFFSTSNMANVLRQAAVLSIVAIGQTFVIINGGIDLSVASMVSMGSLIVANFVVTYQQNWLLATLAATLFCGLLGFFNGTLITVINIPPIIATLATSMAFEGLCLLYTKGYGINLPPGHPVATILGRGNFLGLPISTFFMVGLYLLFYFILRYTTLGRVTYGLGGNENAVHLSGISVRKYRMIIYIISGLLAGFAGVMLAGRVNTGHPYNGNNMEMMSIAATVLGGASVAGGVGNLWGTLIGVFTLTIIENGLNMIKINPYLQMLVKGCIIVLVISFSSLKEKKGNRQ